MHHATAAASAASSPLTSHSAGPEAGRSHGPLLDHLVVASGTPDDARRGDDAAEAGVGRGTGACRGLGIGGDVADLAEQVDALLHVADEVAAGHLVVVEHVGEVVARRPVVRVAA